MNTNYLKDRLTLEYGYSVRVAEEPKGEFPIYGSNGITGYINSFKVTGPGIIIGRKGTVGAVNLSLQNFTPTDTTYYVKLKDESKDNLIFWFYYLQLLGLNKLNSHSSVPGLNRELTYLLQVHPPSLPYQKKIASVLSALDKKIALNNRINDNLFYKYYSTATWPFMSMGKSQSRN